MANWLFPLYIPDNFKKEFSEFKKITKDTATNRVIIRLIRDFMATHTSLHIPTIRKILELNPEQVEQMRLLLNEFKDTGEIKKEGNFA